MLSQSFSDFELILVDDGSPDNCPAICDSYAARDSRIKVIHKENGGLVSARQAGIKIASGEYVFNLDGDDSVCPDALESAYDIIEKHHPDMVCFSYKTCVNGIEAELMEEIVEEGLYSKPDIEKKLYPKLLSDINMNHLFYFAWGKAVKRSLITPHQLNVTRAISLAEDVSCITPCYLEAQSVYMSKKAIYLYTIRDDSLTTSFKTSQITQLATAIEGLRKLNVQKPADFEEQISRYSCFMCFAILAAAAEGAHFKYLKELKSLILGSLHNEEIKKARFESITVKSKITVFLMKRQLIGTAFYFLYLCSKIKRLRKGRKA